MIRIFPDPEQMSQEAANRFVQLAQQQIQTSGRFSAALAGGSTPKRTYEILASKPYRSRIPWQSVYLFWGDERCVSIDHPESNFRMANEALLSNIPIPQANIHRIPVDRADPECAASFYEQTLREFFRLPLEEGRSRCRAPGTSPPTTLCVVPGSVAAPGASALRLQAEAWPEFGLILLGLGEDGHTASLFPRSPALRESHRFAVATTGGHPNLPRVTLTLPVLNHARHLIWLVAGSDKARIVQTVLDGDKQAVEVPAQRVKSANGKVYWLIDRAAANLLRKDQVRTGESV